MDPFRNLIRATYIRLCRSRLLIGTLLGLFSPALALSQDVTRLGGDMSTDFPGRFAIQLPAPNVTDETRRATMLSGFSIFHKIFIKGEGVGPFFVNNSCGGCHVENGRGPISFGGARTRTSPMVVKVSLAGVTSDGSPKPVPGVGGVLQNHGLTGRPRYEIDLKFDEVLGQYSDGKSYKLRRPNLSFRLDKQSRRKVRHSLRMTPPVIGPGLLEEIPEASILALSDPDDLNGDGISGKPNYVLDRRSGLKSLGRFGFKAGQPTVEQQSLAAMFNEMGITNYQFPDPVDSTSEFGGDDLTTLLFYQRLAGVPLARNQTEATVSQGFTLFNSIGCTGCHVATFVTGTSADPELSNQTIHPFTDLLLHDMGPGLADKHQEFDAKGNEWRTSPLWGLGFSETISKVRANFLHDGRARTIEEAILWHGGEGTASRTNFKNLTKAERAALVAFLRSL